MNHVIETYELDAVTNPGLLTIKDAQLLLQSST